MTIKVNSFKNQWMYVLDDQILYVYQLLPLAMLVGLMGVAVMQHQDLLSCLDFKISRIVNRPYLHLALQSYIQFYFVFPVPAPFQALNIEFGNISELPPSQCLFSFQVVFPGYPIF